MTEWAGLGPLHEAKVCRFGGGVGLVNSGFSASLSFQAITFLGKGYPDFHSLASGMGQAVGYSVPPIVSSTQDLLSFQTPPPTPEGFSMNSRAVEDPRYIWQYHRTRVQPREGLSNALNDQGTL